MGEDGGGEALFIPSTFCSYIVPIASFVALACTMSQRVARPVARYRPGQAPAAAQDVDSSDEETVPSSKPVERVRLPSRVTSAPKVAAAVPVAPTAPRPAAAPVDMDEYGM